MWFTVPYEERLAILRAEKEQLVKDIAGSVEGAQAAIEDLLLEKKRLINLLNEARA